MKSDPQPVEEDMTGETSSGDDVDAQPMTDNLLHPPQSLPITIRRMRNEDLERVQAIDQVSFTMPWPARAFRYELNENPHALLWVAEVSPIETVSGDQAKFAHPLDTIRTESGLNQPMLERIAGQKSGVVVGVIVVWMILEEAHIATLAVDPAYRKKGIASQLLSAAIQEALNRRAAQVTLEVRDSNQAAISLYRKFNFYVAGRRVRYYKDTNEDALIMTIDLQTDQVEGGSSSHDLKDQDVNDQKA